LAVTGTPEPLAIAYAMPVASAQVKSAILLAGLNTPGKTTVIESQRTRDHTENMLQHFGFKVNVETLPDGETSISLTGKQSLTGDHDIPVPGDPSSAAFLIVAATISKNSRLTIRNVCLNPLRTGLLTTLEAMGANIEYKNER